MFVPRRIAAAVFVLAVVATPARAQRSPSLPDDSPFLGGVPDPMPTQGTLRLTVLDVVHRALEHNLGVLSAEEGVTRARGARWLALSQLLPNIGGSVSESRQVRNLEAFGFPLRGEFPSIVGPFNVFDARVLVSQRVLDFDAMNTARAQAHTLEASRQSVRNARDLVVLVAANLYLQTIAADARSQSVRAQAETAQALLTQAQDLRQSGIVAGIDVVRAEVRLATEQQRLTAAQNLFQKSKLQLARVIGLPIGQEFTLSEQLPDIPFPDITMEEALDRAYRERPDYLAALERVRAAEAQRDAAVGSGLPSLNVSADYGTIGLTAGSSRATYTMMANLNVPIFEGGRVQGRVLQADAELRSRRNEAEDLRAEIYYDLRGSFLDLQAASEQMEVAMHARDLSAQQLVQSRDRFAAGVAGNIEVIQAQEAVALASEQYIGAAYAFSLSKAMLARALGSAESAVEKYLGGTNP